MSVASFDFARTREELSRSFAQCLATGELTSLEAAYSAAHGSEAEKKGAVEQAFRDQMKHAVSGGGDTAQCIMLIKLLTTAVQQDVCLTAPLFVVMQDLFDSITLDKCDTIFKFIEDRVTLWKSEMFYNAGKNYLLRMCNDLLRRLSKSQNTVFCGRIHLFLARLFPLHEKSGLNLMSQFNLENVTQYNTKDEDYTKNHKLSFAERDEGMEEGETDDSTGSIPIDYTLYRKFWSLQDFFRKPTQCYDKSAWKNFSSCTKDVLNCFESFKLEDVQSTAASADLDHPFFAKYLTSEKLLDLQLSDSNFRRYVLVQFLILFQYLQGQVKFKTGNHVLTDEQTAWIKDTTQQVYNILSQTPTDGSKFAHTIEHMLQREEHWNLWKNDGCQSYVKETEAPPVTRRAKKRSLGEDLKANAGKLVKMGNPELTRLWNLCPNNMDACRSEKRNFTPTMEDFFEEAVEQADPEAGIEEEYKLVKNANFAWKSLRLLAQSSPHFFAQHGSGQTKQLPEYLNMMISKVSKESANGAGGSDEKAEDKEVGKGEEKADMEEEQAVEEDEEGNTSQEDEQLEQANSQDQAASSGMSATDSDLISKDLIEQLAQKAESCWKTLASELGVEEDDISYFESESKETVKQAQKMLTVWSENEGDRATKSVMYQALKEMGQLEIASQVFGDMEET